jgi:hypothetical protein
MTKKDISMRAGNKKGTVSDTTEQIKRSFGTERTSASMVRATRRNMSGLFY